MLARNVTKKAHGGDSSSYSMIHHYSHQHQMTAFHVKESFKSNIWCELCRFNISGSEVFACGACKFLIHKSCAKELPKEIQHFLHPQHPLVLRTEDLQYDGSRLDIQCDSCFEYRSFMAFSCKDCDFNLDPACALHTLSAVKDEILDYNPHPAHDHPLMLAFWKLEDIFFPTPTCIACNQCIDGVEYRCVTCLNFWLHKSCAELPLELEHTLHPQHPLVLSKPLASYFICNVCHDENQVCFYRDRVKPESLAYFCADCEFYMDTRCALPTRTLKHPLHEHPLAYSENNTTKQLSCICCGKRCGYDFYCCFPCNFSLHYDCLFLPPIIHHKCHQWHPLQLFDKFVNGNPDGLYCDYCETIRHPDHGVYRCEECDFTAHIECMTSNWKVSLQATEMMNTGNDRCNQLNIEIAGLKVKIEIIWRNLEAKNGNLKKLVELLDEIESVSKEGRRLGVPENSQLLPTVSSEVTVAKGLIKHPFHKHALTPRVLSEKFQLECSLCSLYCNGSAYCCESCGYFLHRSCALEELPSQLQHPSHPHQPLTLSEGRLCKYSCDDCQYSLNVLTALVTLSPLGFDEKEDNEDEDEEKGIIQHFDHCKHPLASFHIERKLFDTCEVCLGYISGQFYGCAACCLLLHASCARPPRVLNHPFKSSLTIFWSDYSGNQCGFCGGYTENESVYTNTQEDGDQPFLLHIGCALSTTFPRGHQSTCSTDYKKHSSHPCPLVLFHVEEKTGRIVKCELCELKISGEARGCPNCRFFLHESCMDKFPDMIHHLLHPNHPNLILKHKEPSASQTEEYGCHCKICLQKDTPKSRTTYQCDSCEFHLHPRCALKTLAAVEEGVAPSIRHFAHDHPLFLHFFRGNHSVGWCTTCGQIIIGLAYCCITCEYVSFHISCAELPQELEHSFHPQHPLVLLSATSAGYFYCGACHKKSECSAYYCAECEFYLDMQCASLKLAVRYPRHEHKLAYIEESTNNYRVCGACGRSCKIDLYLCVPCDFSIHHDCLPLPPVVEMKCPQKHQLFLRDRFVNGDPNYQYCDHCEELRNPDHGAYVCEECPHTVHIDCAIPRDKVEVEANETEQESEGTENKPEEIESSQMLVSSQANSEAELLKGRIDVMKRNIEAERGNLEASMKHLEELEAERETECK